jgi:hypothetical protein
VSRRLPPLLIALLLLAALAPSGASAESFNFLSNDGLGPSGGAGTVGPASVYPTSLDVEGLPGPLTKVTATMIRFSSGSPDDVDMLLVGPEGDQVMLMSDTCGGLGGGFSNDTLTFDDDAPAFLPDNGPCPTKSVATFKPSNYVGDSEPDQFGAGGGIFPPYSSTLSTFAGTDPNGFWDLYVLDDHEGVVGFEILGWALTLTVASPLTPPPTIVQTVTVPGPPASTGSSSSGAKATPAKTGKRAAALAKCAKKNSKEKRLKCRKKARKLPV